MAAVYKALAGGSSRETAPSANGAKENRQRVLILSSRGTTFRHRHLLSDIHSLLPHSRKEAKFDSKTKLHELNELADLYNCNNILFFEARKAKDLYLWLSKPPNGPTVKLHVQNMHTMDELHFSGNCLKGSRPILSFDAAFERDAHLRVIKELLMQTFGVPKGARKSKPFIDHVMGFTVADGRIWIRVYQITETEAGSKSAADQADSTVNGSAGTKKSSSSSDPAVSLVEIGPRFVLTPIVVLESSFGGPVIYENKEFVSPNQVRSDLRHARAGRFNLRTEAALDSKKRRGEMGLLSEGGRRPEKDPLDNRELFR